MSLPQSVTVSTSETSGTWALVPVGSSDHRDSVALFANGSANLHVYSGDTNVSLWAHGDDPGKSVAVLVARWSPMRDAYGAGPADEEVLAALKRCLRALEQPAPVADGHVG